MEGLKHFSHNHSLNHHQIPQGTEIPCSGCKLTATGTVYACFPCKFYLHENCYRATRSFRHPSHPSHPLTLVPYPTYPSNSFYCNTCTLIGTGFSYSCCNCEFDLHIHCAYNHSSHQHLPPPNHTQSFVHHQPMSNHFLTPNAPPHTYMPHQAVTHHSNPHNQMRDAEDLADQLAAAQIAAKIAAKGRQNILESLDPPGTKYEYKYYDNI